ANVHSGHTAKTARRTAARDVWEAYVIQVTDSVPKDVSFLAIRAHVVINSVQPEVLVKTVGKRASGAPAVPVIPSRVTAHAAALMGGQAACAIQNALSNMASVTAGPPVGAVRRASVRTEQESVRWGVCLVGDMRFVTFRAWETTTGQTVFPAAVIAWTGVAFGPETAEEHAQTDGQAFVVKLAAVPRRCAPQSVLTVKVVPRVVTPRGCVLTDAFWDGLENIVTHLALLGNSAEVVLMIAETAKADHKTAMLNTGSSEPHARLACTGQSVIDHVESVQGEQLIAIPSWVAAHTAASIRTMGTGACKATQTALPAATVWAVHPAVTTVGPVRLAVSQDGLGPACKLRAEDSKPNVSRGIFWGAIAVTAVLWFAMLTVGIVTYRRISYKGVMDTSRNAPPRGRRGRRDSTINSPGGSGTSPHGLGNFPPSQSSADDTWKSSDFHGGSSLQHPTLGSSRERKEQFMQALAKYRSTPRTLGQTLDLLEVPRIASSKKDLTKNTGRKNVKQGQHSPPKEPGKTTVASNSTAVSPSQVKTEQSSSSSPAKSKKQALSVESKSGKDVVEIANSPSKKPDNEGGDRKTNQGISTQTKEQPSPEEKSPVSPEQRLDFNMKALRQEFLRAYIPSYADNEKESPKTSRFCLVSSDTKTTDSESYVPYKVKGASETDTQSASSGSTDRTQKSKTSEKRSDTDESEDVKGIQKKSKTARKGSETRDKANTKQDYSKTAKDSEKKSSVDPKAKPVNKDSGSTNKPYPSPGKSQTGDPKPVEDKSPLLVGTTRKAAVHMPEPYLSAMKSQGADLKSVQDSPNKSLVSQTRINTSYSWQWKGEVGKTTRAKNSPNKSPTSSPQWNLQKQNYFLPGMGLITVSEDGQFLPSQSHTSPGALRKDIEQTAKLSSPPEQSHTGNSRAVRDFLIKNIIVPEASRKDPINRTFSVPWRGPVDGSAAMDKSRVFPEADKSWIFGKVHDEYSEQLEKSCMSREGDLGENSSDRHYSPRKRPSDFDGPEGFSSGARESHRSPTVPWKRVPRNINQSREKSPRKDSGDDDQDSLRVLNYHIERHRRKESPDVRDYTDKRSFGGFLQECEQFTTSPSSSLMSTDGWEPRPKQDLSHSRARGLPEGYKRACLQYVDSTSLTRKQGRQRRSERRSSSPAYNRDHGLRRHSGFSRESSSSPRRTHDKRPSPARGHFINEELRRELLYGREFYATSRGRPKEGSGYGRQSHTKSPSHYEDCAHTRRDRDSRSSQRRHSGHRSRSRNNSHSAERQRREPEGKRRKFLPFSRREYSRDSRGRKSPHSRRYSSSSEDSGGDSQRARHRDYHLERLKRFQGPSNRKH
ncbi:hypothetical protein BaRGS_00028261, partial [Batillaria attramentaria]